MPSVTNLLQLAREDVIVLLLGVVDERSHVVLGANASLIALQSLWRLKVEFNVVHLDLSGLLHDLLLRGDDVIKLLLLLHHVLLLGGLIQVEWVSTCDLELVLLELLRRLVAFIDLSVKLSQGLLLAGGLTG